MKKLLFFLLLTILPLSGLNAQNILGTSDSATLIFVRHAEKADDGTRNPPLTKEGEARAERIKVMLKKAYSKVDAVYSTEYKRTELTALPVSKEFDLDIQSYDPRAPKVFIKKLIKDHQGEVVLIVGHSNTTPFLVNMVLGEEKFAQLDESAYDDVFIVKSKEVGKGTVEIKSSAIKK
ncbi:MAG: phosphoglycerate mutase family protein [Balneola sp.]|jgi:2,3-bisphosphoglycerate-dependent phosphoglycerate mutase